MPPAEFSTDSLVSTGAAIHRSSLADCNPCLHLHLWKILLGDHLESPFPLVLQNLLLSNLGLMKRSCHHHDLFIRGGHLVFAEELCDESIHLFSYRVCNPYLWKHPDEVPDNLAHPKMKDRPQGCHDYRGNIVILLQKNHIAVPHQPLETIDRHCRHEDTSC